MITMSHGQKLDSGGQGTVYAVGDSTAVKVVKFGGTYKELSELCVLNALPHPCIVKLKRWELTRDECKIYMERMHSNMYDFSKRASFEKRLELFPNIFWSMVRVARFFQRNGVMNCDIKSENVMLSKDGKQVKIIDFGHLVCDEKYPIIGTRSYQPPELWLDDTFTSKSMVWSIAISCLEFLYRIHPIVDIIYGDGDDSSGSDSGRLSGSGSRSSVLSASFSCSSYSEDEEYRDRYCNLFEILSEEGASLPFRHRLDVPTNKAVKEKLSSINAVLERMLTYDVKARISLEELYRHRIFERVRGTIADEPVMTVAREPLMIDKELTMVFMHLARKLYREEIVVQAYSLLSAYLEKSPRRGHEFFVTAMACLDIMSYVFSIMPSSRGASRKIVLKMRGVTEYAVMDRVIEVLKALQFKVFLHTPVETIKGTASNKAPEPVLFPLLLELIETDAEAGKKRLTSQSLLDRYLSDDYSSDKEYASDDEFEIDEPEPVSEAAEAASVDDDEDFLESFKARVQQAYQQEKQRRIEDNEPADVLVIRL